MSDDSEFNWWQNLLSGVVLLVITGALFWYFTDLETSGGRGRIHWIIAILYKLGGKWVACSVLGVAGLVLVGVGVKGWNDQR